MERMTNKEVLEWASEATLRWAKRAYANLYPEWYKTIIISGEIDAYWKAYDKHEKGSNLFLDDPIAELICFRNHYDCPMYKSEFQHMMKVDCEKLVTLS
jgi:hypothetical protein